MRIALCNEVLAPMSFGQQCEFAAALGYDGLEIAPFTLNDDPLNIPSSQVSEIRQEMKASGLALVGLHWLLVKPEGLSITSPDKSLRLRTLSAMERLVGLCAELGGRVLVHGSPAQRRIAPGSDHATALAYACECWAAAGEAARRAGVIYCIEPLSSDQTDIINRVEQAAAIVTDIGNPALRTMVDTSSAGLAEQEPVADILRQWLPKGVIAHIQVNDRNRRGPGQGKDAFAPIFKAIIDSGYAGDVSVEPFDYRPDGPATAAFSAGYIRGILEGVRASR